MRYPTILAISIAAAFATATVHAATDEQKQMAYGSIDRNAGEIATVSDSLYYFAEPGMQEFESAKLLKETFESIGFKVETGRAGMPTAVWATFGSGKPHVVIVTEIDALPEGSQTPGSMPRKPLVAGAPGHMEGHNVHGGVSVGALNAVKQVMEKYKIPGTVSVSFGPAEEQLASRPFLVRSGQFRDADAAILIHIGDNLSTGYGLQNYAAISAKFSFKGKTAHGAVNPWDGRDAVDAVELMDAGYNALREHLRPTQRAHRTITAGGVQPNIIPDFGQTWWFVRDANAPYAKENFDKLVNIAKGAALMTGTEMSMEVIASAWPQLGNRVLSDLVSKNIDAVGLPKWTPEEDQWARDFQKSLGIPVVGLARQRVSGNRPQSFASNDSGDVTWNVPTGNLSIPAAVPGVGAHNWQAGVTPTLSLSHKGQVSGAKVLAGSILDILTEPQTLTQAKAEFDGVLKDSPYFSLVPAEAKPDTTMNKEMMDRFRPEMTKYYLNKKATFK